MCWGLNLYHQLQFAPKTFDRQDVGCCHIVGLPPVPCKPSVPPCRLLRLCACLFSSFLVLLLNPCLILSTTEAGA